MAFPGIEDGVYVDCTDDESVVVDFVSQFGGQAQEGRFEGVAVGAGEGMSKRYTARTTNLHRGRCR